MNEIKISQQQATNIVKNPGIKEEESRKDKGPDQQRSVSSEDKQSPKAEFRSIDRPIIEPPKNELMSSADIAMAFLMLQNEINSSLISSCVDDINFQREVVKEDNKKIVEKLDEQLKSRDKANRESNASRILSWLGAVFGFIFAAVATAVTGGAAAPLLVGAAIGLAVTILEETGAVDKIIEGVSKFIADIMIKNGESPEDAHFKANTIATAIVSAILIAVTVGSCFIGANPAGLATAGGAIARIAPKATASISKILKISKVKDCLKAEKFASRGEVLTQGITSTTSGGLSIASGVERGKSGEARAEYMNLLTSQNFANDIIRENSGFIKDIMDSKERSFTQCLEILKDLETTNRNIIRNSV